MLDSFLEAFFSIGEKLSPEETMGVFDSPKFRRITDKDRCSVLHYYDAKTPGTSWFYKGSFRKVAGNFFIIKGNAFSNIIQVGPTYNRVELCDTSSFNTVQGNLESDIMGADNNAQRNDFDGGPGNDQLYAEGNANYNIFNGGLGIDRLYALDNASHNIFNGELGIDDLYALDKASHNIFNGGAENDALRAYDNASHNIFNGGNEDDWLYANGNASNNIFNGGNGNDIFLVFDKAFSNFFNGGDGDDVVLSLAGGTFDGGQGDDFIINHLVDQKFVANVIAKGGEGQDVLIHSAFFWQSNQIEFKDYKRHDATRITLDGGSGDDVIMPYLQADFSEANWVGNDVASKIAKCNQYLIPSATITDSSYDITPGLGSDVICLTDRPAEATQTIIKGFDFVQDQLAFPNQVMADTVLPHLLKAQAENLPIIEWIHNGHHYRLEDNQYAKIQTQPGTLSYKIWDENLTNSALAEVNDIKKFYKSVFNGVFTSKTTP